MRTRSRLEWMALIAFASGVIWRVAHIVFIHPATSFVYSDMSFYHSEAMRWCAGGRFTIKDIMHPPGAGLWFGMLCRLDPSYRICNWVMAVASSSVPVGIGLLARKLYGERTALIAVIFASLYFPFIDFFALFISEGPFLTVIVPAFVALVIALRTTGWRAHLAAVAAGVGLGFAASVRPVAMIWLGAVLLVLTIWLLRMPKKWLLTAGLLGLGAAAVLTPIAARCTRLNAGQFCIAGTMGPLNIVLGHVTDVRRVVWHDRRDGTYYYASSPVSFQNHSTRELSLPFAAEDGPSNMAYARTLFTTHPGDFMWQSLRELSFLIGGNFPWPTYETPWRPYGIVAEYLFWIFVMIPALLTVLTQRRALLRLSRDAEVEMILLLPLLATMAVSLASVGETRYRVGCDGFLMILAAAAWARVTARAPDCN